MENYEKEYYLLLLDLGYLVDSDFQLTEEDKADGIADIDEKLEIDHIVHIEHDGLYATYKDLRGKVVVMMKGEEGIDSLVKDKLEEMEKEDLIQLIGWLTGKTLTKGYRGVLEEWNWKLIEHVGYFISEYTEGDGRIASILEAKKYAPKKYKPKSYHPKEYKTKKPKKYITSEVLKSLLLLANNLDNKGFYEEASKLDHIITGASDEAPGTGVAEGTHSVGAAEEATTTNQPPHRPGVDPHVYRDPRVVEGPDGVLKCRDCGAVIPIEEDQLGCSRCEEEKNLGFLKTPDGSLHPPRLKNPPRIYDRYREELPEDVEMQTGFNREREELLKKKKENRVNRDLYPHSGGEPY